MPLYMLVRPSKKGRVRETKGLRDHMQSKRTQANPVAPPDAIPCYVVDAPQEFDEPGKELSPDAQVWKTYVREADQVDEELVDGWNKSMDVILIFRFGKTVIRDTDLLQAALFSAISTAFVIESYKNLKQDPSDVSSETLVAISKTLAFIANGSQPTTAPPTSGLETAEFRASAKAICVNVLWFLSLSLSVAVSLISMLAKEWCLEFMAGRTGPPGAQARRRQQRWDGLVGWKMKEVIVILPSLIHLSLLLFAIGLCVFLWDVHFGVAVPVVLVTILAVGAYFACTILPFLYDYCPYGTVLSRLYQQFTIVRSQTAQEGAKQDEVTAKALGWMIENCETPRSVDVALQSLAGADETLSPQLLEECSAWIMIKTRLDEMNPQSQPELNRAIALYGRALQSYPIVRRGRDYLEYGANPATQRLEYLVLSVQCVINRLIHEATMNAAPVDQNTKALLQKCTLIGQSYLFNGNFVKPRSGLSQPIDRVVDLGHYAGDISECLERFQEDKLSRALYNALSASFAFTMCCIASLDPVENSVKLGHALRFFAVAYGRLGPTTWRKSASKADVTNPALGTLWMLISSDYSIHKSTSAQTPHTSTELALDVLWACTMSTVTMNEFALNTVDVTHILHGLLRMRINSHLWDLTSHQNDNVQRCLYSILHYWGDSAKIQSSYHAGYIEDITRDMALGSNEGEHAAVLIKVLSFLLLQSPGEQIFLLPTPEIYMFLIKQAFNNKPRRHEAITTLLRCPFPKYSPRLAEQLSTSDLISHLYNAMDGGDVNKQAFASAYLWLLLDMSLRTADRTSPTMNTLETALLGYPALDNDLNKQEEAIDDLETRLVTLLDQHKVNGLEPKVIEYLCRVLELTLQRKCAPLPKEVYERLERIPSCLRGITSLVNLETERNIAYPEIACDSEGWIIKASREERI